MSKSRQPSQEKASELTVRSLGLRLPHGHRIDSHEHGWGQLIFASRGMMGVEAVDKRWAVPPARAVWAPAGVAHSIETIGETWMRTIYLRPGMSDALPEQIRVIDVSPLLRELILETVRIGLLIEAHQVHDALATMLVDQICRSRELGLALGLPVDPRARAIVERVFQSIDCDHALEKLAEGTGLSPRTAERLFLKETGLSFGRWRQQARLQHAIRRLAEGRNVTQVAFDCGYSSVSAFVAMFKKNLGATPGQYQCERGEDGTRLQ